MDMILNRVLIMSIMFILSKNWMETDFAAFPRRAIGFWVRIGSCWLARFSRFNGAPFGRRGLQCVTSAAMGIAIVLRCRSPLKRHGKAAQIQV